jgi:hypothetical protein
MVDYTVSSYVRRISWCYFYGDHSDRRQRRWKSRIGLLPALHCLYKRGKTVERVENAAIITEALSRLRIPKIIEEFQLYNLISTELIRSGIRFEREVRLGPRSRIDYLCEDGIGIEVKKSKPPQAKIMEQLGKYAASPRISALILVVERFTDLPEEINGKPCKSIGLNRLWGIAL